MSAPAAGRHAEFRQGWRPAPLLGRHRSHAARCGAPSFPSRDDHPGRAEHSAQTVVARAHDAYHGAGCCFVVDNTERLMTMRIKRLAEIVETGEAETGEE